MIDTTLKMKFLQWKKYMTKMTQYFLYHFRNICEPQNEKKNKPFHKKPDKTEALLGPRRSSQSEGK